MLGHSHGSAVWRQGADPGDLQPWSPHRVRIGADQVQRRCRADVDPVQMQSGHSHDHGLRHHLECGGHEHLFRAFDLSRHVFLSCSRIARWIRRRRCRSQRKERLCSLLLRAAARDIRRSQLGHRRRVVVPTARGVRRWSTRLHRLRRW
jgi:hypothetical protein